MKHDVSASLCSVTAVAGPTPYVGSLVALLPSRFLSFLPRCTQGAGLLYNYAASVRRQPPLTTLLFDEVRLLRQQ